MTKVLSELTGDLLTKTDFENGKRDIKLWIGTALVMTIGAVGAIVALIVNFSKLAGH